MSIAISSQDLTFGQSDAGPSHSKASPIPLITHRSSLITSLGPVNPNATFPHQEDERRKRSTPFGGNSLPISLLLRGLPSNSLSL